MTPPKEYVFTNIGKNFAETLQFEDLPLKNVCLFFYEHIFVKKKIWISIKNIFL